jgi:hypothetical protein
MEVPVGPVTLPKELVRAELDRRLLPHRGADLMMNGMFDTPTKDRSGGWLVLDLRGPELLRAGQESNQIARAMDQYWEMLRTYPEHRTAIVERKERHLIRVSATRDAFLLSNLFRHIGIPLVLMKQASRCAVKPDPFF